MTNNIIVDEIIFDKILIYVLVNMGNSCCILFDIVTQNPGWDK